MRLFEIIFILLLMLPVALLMRYFVTRLSAQMSYQKRNIHDPVDDKPSIREWLQKKNQKLQEEELEEELYEPEPEPEPVRSYVQPRSMPQIVRTERVPFSEIYGESPPGSLDTGNRQEPSEKKRVAPEKKRQLRSEKRPSKRQKRKNRERARKRELNRRERTNR